jgi:uncharacterized lipoprotein YddW (UPF0748 family)
MTSFSVSLVTALRRLVVFLSMLLGMVLPTQEFHAAWADVFHLGMRSQSQVDTMVSTLASGHYNAVIVQVVDYMDPFPH